MEVLVTSLDALLQKATNANLERPDPAALEAFCTVLANSPNGAYIATRVIASRIKSPHPTEALLTLEVLDACMKRCDVVFHAEVDKFRFLNEMIKLVSPKYYGNKTAPAVRQKVLTLMHEWTRDYPRELKIKDAYEMLKKQGVVKNVPPPTPVEETPVKPRPKDALFDDEEKSKVLQKLLQSKNPEDLQAANRLIKTMVREDERRVEAVSKLASVLQTVHNNVRLLDEMLDQYHPNQSSTDDLELIKELHTECYNLRPTVFKFAAETQSNDDMLNEIIEVSDELARVLDKYSKVISKNVKNQSEAALVNGNSLLDLATPNDADPEPSTANQSLKCTNSNLEVLGDIFSSVNCEKENNAYSIPVLTPVTLTSPEEVNAKIPNKGLDELDALGEELLKSALPSSHKSAQFSRAGKLPMNLLAKSNSPTKVDSNNSKDFLDIEYLISKTLNTGEKSQSDDAMVDLSDEHVDKAKSKDESLIECFKTETKEPEVKTPISDEKAKSKCEIKPLTDINITLESIKCGSISPMTLFEEADGITIILHFTTNKPRPDVFVFVVSATSRNVNPINDFKFQAVVPKNCKLRLLKASGDSFPAFSPFLPPAAVTQIMLIARPVDDPPPISLKFIITYVCQEDTVSEIGEIKCLPLDSD